MTSPILTVRPEPGCAATIAAGREAGLTVRGFPIFEVRPLEWAPPRGDFDGVLLGSANALLHGGPLVDNLVDMPVYAVGKTTADAARRRGFGVAATGTAGLQALLDEMAGRHFRLLRLAGRDRVALVPPPGITIETAIVYEASVLPLPPEAAKLLRTGALVLLHSAAAARHFAAECDRCVIHRGAIRLAALSARVAEAAGSGWLALRAAAEPSEAALLALARDMCHNPPRG